jgi:hypothetical protein
MAMGRNVFKITFKAGTDLSSIPEGMYDDINCNKFGGGSNGRTVSWYAMPKGPDVKIESVREKLKKYDFVQSVEPHVLG